MTEYDHVLDPVGDLVLILSTASLVAYKTPVGDKHIGHVDITGSSTTCQDSCESLEVRFRVSSKHLTLASRVFNSMLKPGFLEGDKLRTQGCADLRLPEDNPAALLILLNLIHGRFKQVPLKVDLCMLTELAILVDKYELLEITDIVLKSWLEDLEKSIKQEFNDDLLPLMCISYVFRKPDIFRQVTRTAQMEGDGPIKEYRLPIPASVLKEIDRSRANALAESFAYIQEVLKSYQGSKRNCALGLKCDAMVLGSLTLGLAAIGVLQPPPFPYDGFCLKTLAQQLCDIQVLQYCTLHEHTRNYGHFSDTVRCQGVMIPLQVELRRLGEQLHGLWLDNFTRNEQVAQVDCVAFTGIKEYGAGAEKLVVLRGSSVQVSVEIVEEEEVGGVYVYTGYEGNPGADDAKVGPGALVLKTGIVKEENDGDVAGRAPLLELTEGVLKVYENEAFAELGAKPLLAVPKLLYDGGVGSTVSMTVPLDEIGKAPPKLETGAVPKDVKEGIGVVEVFV
ncbi:hypothetical protein MMC11_002433 [Xylographa trunciseda]|nr:hypothetical protein [Xylographa trunciseda]